jgi:hypothetical protein
MDSPDDHTTTIRQRQTARNHPENGEYLIFFPIKQFAREIKTFPFLFANNIKTMDAPNKHCWTMRKRKFETYANFFSSSTAMTTTN